MYRTLCKTTVFALMLALTLAPRGIAQQQQHQHPDGPPASQEQPAATGGEKDGEGDAQAPRMQQIQGMMQQMRSMMQQMRSMMSGGMMGHGGMLSGMMQRHLARLAQQLGLNDDQRAQAQTLMRNHAKEIIRLRADIATMQIDTRQLLDTDPVDLPKVKQLVQTMAAKEADVRLSHITAMQEIRKLLTPEQQKKFRAMQDAMMGDGGMMGPGGMMGQEGMMGRGGMMSHGPRAR
jgi:Spy/CpxP family protein refolding chaperone